MLVVHTTPTDEGKLAIWAEDSSLPPQHPPKPGRPPNVPDPRDHPFAASSETLQATCEEVCHGSLQSGSKTEVTLLLPSGRFGPQPSPSLVRDAELDGKIDRVSPWVVPAITCTPALLRDIANAATDESTTVQPGETLTYWTTVISFAEELVRNGRVIPQIKCRDEQGWAVWRALPSTTADFERLRSLREAVPPLLRARVTDATRSTAEEAKDWGDAEVQSAHDVLTRTLDEYVDTIVRQRLTSVDTAQTTGTTIQGQWLEALTSHDASIEAPSEELETLQQHLDEWTQGLETAGEDGVRLCFRLWAPEPETAEENTEAMADSIDAVSADGWEVELLLQAADDPSLLVEAETVWDSAATTQDILERHLERPQETLLEELGRATGLYPKLETVLEESTPTELKLTTEEAATFLREHAEVLQQAGFGVILPAWWNDSQRRLGARLSADGDSTTTPDSTVGGIGVEQLCDVQWEVVLGDETLSKEELAELAALKMPLVRVRGQWVSLQEGDVEAALELYEQADDEMSVGDALQVDTELGDTSPELPVVDNQFTGTLSDLFDEELETWVEDAETPAGFDGQLRPYQNRGLGWISYLEQLGFGGCLADDMGLGKTIQVLARLVEEREAQSVGSTLVVCPLSVVGNWKHEAHEFAPQLDVAIHHGTDRPTGDTLADTITNHDLIVTTYGVVRNDIEQLQEIQFHRVVLDEAQKIKNTEAKRTQAIRALSTQHRLALTGTPVENRLSELWSIMEFCNPGLLGSETAFRDAFARPIEQHGNEEKLSELRRLIRPFILRRSKTDETVIDDLPSKIETKEYCTLTEEQASLYKAATDELLGAVAEADDMERRGKVLQLINALKAICNHPRQYNEDDSQLAERSGKLTRLEELTTEILANDERALIFTQYTSMADLIKQHLQQRLGREVLYLHGGTPQEQRDEMVERFQSSDGPPLFLLSLRAGGTGLTLTAANHVIHFDRWWNPAVEDQATDRTYRIGQSDDVHVHKLICEGTVEEAIDQTIEQKRELAEQVLAEGDDWLTELSDDELRDIVTLSEHAYQ